MTRIDQTPLFRSLLHPSSSTSSSSSSSPSPQLRNRSAGRQGKPPTRHVTEEEQASQTKEKEFLKEAYRINNHITTLSTLLRSVRRAYLSTQPQPQRVHHPTRARGHPISSAAVTEGTDEDADSLRGLESAKFLSEREKDEVDLRAKVIMKTCRERIRLLEVQEKARQSSTPSTSSLLHSILPSLAPPSQTPNTAILTAHRASIIYHLTSSLSHVAQTQYEMQEERGRRRDERSRTLGGQIAKSTITENGKMPEIQLTIPTTTTDDAPTHEQSLIFAQENDILLSQMSSTLSTVLSAESSILEISQLQSSLIAHLQSQSETIDRLYDDAVGTVNDVERANKELRKAKERGGEARVFLLVFLIGGSLTLLFLDWYS